MTLCNSLIQITKKFLHCFVAFLQPLVGTHNESEEERPLLDRTPEIKATFTAILRNPPPIPNNAWVYTKFSLCCLAGTLVNMPWFYSSMDAVESLTNRLGLAEESREIYGYITASITLVVNAAASAYVTKQAFDYVLQFLHFRGDHRLSQLIIPLGIATCASIPAASASYLNNVGFWQRPLTSLTFMGTLFYTLNGAESIAKLVNYSFAPLKARYFRSSIDHNALIKKHRFLEKIQILINAPEDPLLGVRDEVQLLELINNVQLSELHNKYNILIQGGSFLLACLPTVGQASIDFWLTKKALAKLTLRSPYLKSIVEALIILPGNIYALDSMAKGIKHSLEGNWDHKSVIYLFIGLGSIIPTLHIGYNTAISELNESGAITISILSASKQAIFTGLALRKLVELFYSLLARKEKQLEHARIKLRALSTKLEKCPPRYFTALASNSFFTQHDSRPAVTLVAHNSKADINVHRRSSLPQGV